jgi:hypothetical protein
MEMNGEGLGTAPLGKFIGRNANHGADNLKQVTTKFVIEQTSAKGISRDDAESLGMSCAPAPSPECSYSGEFWIRSDQRYVRHDSPAYRTREFYHVDVRLSQRKPHDVVVQADVRYVPDE